MSYSTIAKEFQKMPRSCRRLGYTVSCVLGMAVAAPAAGAQHLVYIDFIVPFNFRDLHASIVEVRPNCEVGPVGAPLTSKPYFKTGSNIIGETLVQNMNKSADGSYSVTLTERVEVNIPTSITAGTIMPYYCTVRGKTMGGTIRDLSQVGAGFAALGLSGQPEAFTLAPGSTDKVNGQFTW